MPRAGGRDGSIHGMLDIRHVAKKRRDLVAFPLELVLVGEVLVLAASTIAEERTFRRDPVRAGAQDLEKIGMGAVLVVAPDPDPHPFAGEGIGDEDHPAMVGWGRITALVSLPRRILPIVPRRLGRQGDPADPGAQVREGVDGEFELLVVAEWLGTKFSGWLGHALSVALAAICE